MSSIREKLEDDEEKVLSPFAQKSRASKGRDRPEPPDPVRPIFQHDRDRIIHSKAFRRLAGKTQVFLAPEGDHYRTRITHTLEVAQIARTVTRALRPQRIADRGDRHGARPRPHAVRPRGREGAGQADARRVPPRQTVDPGGREAGTGRAGAEPLRRGARRDPQALEGEGAHHLGQPEPDGHDPGGADRPHQRHRRLREPRSRRRRPRAGRRSGLGPGVDPRRCSAVRTASASRGWSTTWCRPRGWKKSARSG